MTDSLFTGKYKVGFRTWTSDGICSVYRFGDHKVVGVTILHRGGGEMSIKWGWDDPNPFGEELPFELIDNELHLLEVPEHGAYFTAWYEYD